MFFPIYLWIALFVSFLWGMNSILSKRLLAKFSIISTMTFTSIAYFVAIVLFAAMNFKQIKDDFQIMNHYDALTILIAALVLSFFANLLYYFVLKSHESSIVTAVVYSSPVFTLLVAHFFMKEKINGFGIFGILLIVAGLVSISYNDKTATSINDK